MCNVYINIYNEICNGIVKETKKGKSEKIKLTQGSSREKGTTSLHAQHHDIS